jgi:hypothetical protein
MDISSIIQIARDVAGDAGMVAGGVSVLATACSVIFKQLGWDKPAAVCSRIVDGALAVTIDLKKLGTAVGALKAPSPPPAKNKRK